MLKQSQKFSLLIRFLKFFFISHLLDPHSTFNDLCHIPWLSSLQQEEDYTQDQTSPFLML